MIVGGDPDAAQGILKEREDQGFFDAILRPKTMKLGAVIAKEAIFRRDPEEACLILYDLEDVEIAQTFVLAVVVEDEVLRSGVRLREEINQYRDKNPLTALQSTTLNWSAEADQLSISNGTDPF